MRFILRAVPFGFLLGAKPMLHHSSAGWGQCRGAAAGTNSGRFKASLRQGPAPACAVPHPNGESSATAAEVQLDPTGQPLAFDPEAKFNRYGKHFNGRFWLSDLVDSAPRVRVRTTASRQRSELLELAVLNERLAGNVEPWEARARLEVLRNRRRAWDAVYDLIGGSDAAATLEMIEAAAEQVRCSDYSCCIIQCTSTGWLICSQLSATPSTSA